MGDKRMQKLHDAINFNVTALMTLDRKAKQHEIAHALIESAFWVMEGEKGAEEYLEEAFNEIAYWNSQCK